MPDDAENRREDMRQIGAISSFEGMHPTDSFASLRERYVSGELTIKDFRRAVEARWTPNGGGAQVEGVGTDQVAIREPESWSKHQF